MYIERKKKGMMCVGGRGNKNVWLHAKTHHASRKIIRTRLSTPTNLLSTLFRWRAPILQFLLLLNVAHATTTQVAHGTEVRGLLAFALLRLEQTAEATFATDNLEVELGEHIVAARGVKGEIWGELTPRHDDSLEQGWDTTGVEDLGSELFDSNSSTIPAR